jgi:hypothetical protein
MADSRARHLEAISEGFQLIEWTCSSCSWKKRADDPQRATEGTMAMFMAHHCEDYPPNRGREQPSAAKPLAFILVPCFA